MENERMVMTIRALNGGQAKLLKGTFIFFIFFLRNDVDRNGFK